MCANLLYTELFCEIQRGSVWPLHDVVVTVN
jgi:hypothetical protein